METPGLLRLAYPVRAVRDLQEPSKNTAAVLAQSLQPRLGHSTVVLFLTDAASMAPFWTLGLLFSEHRWQRLQTPVRSSVANAICNYRHPS